VYLSKRDFAENTCKSRAKQNGGKFILLVLLVEVGISSFFFFFGGVWWVGAAERPGIIFSIL
jgi:hypothetical protein